MPHLFDPLALRSVTLRNRIAMSPMCQYSSPGSSADDAGQATAWHHTHLVSRAVGGCGLVMAEATAVEPRGRISLADTGLWNDAQLRSWKPIVAQIAAHGAVPAIQLAHAGRKAGTAPPWEGGRPYAQYAEEAPLLEAPAKGRRGRSAAEQWTYTPVAPSVLPFDDGWAVPRALSVEEIGQLIQRWVEAAQRAASAGFQLLELHMAHGYLLHSFYSPLSNQRTDAYGGSLENRIRLPLELAAVVRAVWPNRLPLVVRISASDWVPGGWDIAQSVQLARRLRELGVDLIDCSSAANVPHRLLPKEVQARMHHPLYQVPFAEAVRREAGIATAAVGLITTAAQAQSIVSTGRADIVMLARTLLREPYWPLLAAHELGVDLPWPRQYLRARWS